MRQKSKDEIREGINFTAPPGFTHHLILRMIFFHHFVQVIIEFAIASKAEQRRARKKRKRRNG